MHKIEMLLDSRSIIVKTTMSSNLNPSANTFVPNNDNMNLQLEFEDAFQEYAYENGLWGVGGVTHTPSDTEIDNMRREFTGNWINMYGKNENIEYQILR